MGNESEKISPGSEVIQDRSMFEPEHKSGSWFSTVWYWLREVRWWRRFWHTNPGINVRNSEHDI